MNNFDLFCMCLNDHHLNILKKLNYIPVGLGKNNFSSDWLRDNTLNNISEKNSYYGEYTFYYWYWKNILPNLNKMKWTGFCGYRYHWSQNNDLSSEEISKKINSENFNNYILKSIPEEWSKYDVVLGEEMRVDKWKFSKIFKHGKKKLINNPFAFLEKNRNIKLHFDVFHGEGKLDKAINVLDYRDRDDFRKFVNNKRSFNRENIFFCRSKEIMNQYFSSVFSWLKKCEPIFGFNLEGYANTRIYAFLAERYISFWFNKYTKPLSWPVFFFDTNKNKINILK